MQSIENDYYEITKRMEEELEYFSGSGAGVRKGISAEERKARKRKKKVAKKSKRRNSKRKNSKRNNSKCKNSKRKNRGGK